MSKDGNMKDQDYYSLGFIAVSNVSSIRSVGHSRQALVDKSNGRYGSGPGSEEFLWKSYSKQTFEKESIGTFAKRGIPWEI